jgi:hypothetical protein
VPQLEGGFLRLYKGASPQSTHDYAELGFATIHQAWGRYSLVEILQAPDSEHYIGFYNDIIQWEYAPANGFFRPGMGTIPIDRAPAGGRIAIIGSGGGRQVQYARKSGRDFERVLAIEIEPAVLEAVQGPLAERFDHVYRAAGVELVNHEARSHMEGSTERFDLIYLPSVGGYPQMMLEPGNMIRTIDAFATLRDRLSERGVLAIWYPAVLDPRKILTEQYLRTLEGPQIGLQVRAFRSPGDVLIVAAHRSKDLPTLQHVSESFFQSVAAQTPLFPWFVAMPVEVEKSWEEASFRPISDNQPFLAGNVQHIFSLGQVGILFALVAGVLVLFAGLLFLVLRKRATPKYRGGRMPRWC